MDIENLENDSAKSPEPERITDMDSGDPGVHGMSERS
jgi:hypothetical protein